MSATREGGRTTWFRIAASRTRVLRVHDNFGGHVPSWNRPSVEKVGANYEAPVKVGDVLEARVGPAPRAFPKGQLSRPAEIWNSQESLPDRIDAQRVPWP